MEACIKIRRWPDVVLAAVLLVATGALYARWGLRLAAGEYLDYYNLGFDFDPSRFVQVMGLTPPDYFDVKHPLMIMLRPLAWPFLQAGLTPHQAAVLVMAVLGAARVAVCWLFLRALHLPRMDALALTLLFGVTGTQVFTAFITESYGPSALVLQCIWLLTVLRLCRPGKLRGTSLAAGVIAFGLTVTNTAIPFLAEAMVQWRRIGAPDGWRTWLRRMLRYAAAFALVAAVPVVAVWHAELAAALADPVQAMKDVYWKRTKGPAEGLGQMLLVFAGLSFVSPDATTIMLPEGVPMRDFRNWSFEAAGTAAMVLWLAMLASGAAGMLALRRTRLLAGGLLAALAFNLALHADFQFRGSLYIYASHTHFLFFALACGLAPWVQLHAALRAAYLGAVLLLAMLVASVNLPAAEAFVADFDHVDVPCRAPCADGLPR